MPTTSSRILEETLTRFAKRITGMVRENNVYLSIIIGACLLSIALTFMIGTLVHILIVVCVTIPLMINSFILSKRSSTSLASMFLTGAMLMALFLAAGTLAFVIWG